MAHCPPMAVTVTGDCTIAKGILNFLVENDLSLQDVIDALIICQNVEGLDYGIKQTIKDLRDQYVQSQGVLMNPLSKKVDKKVQKKVVPRKIKKNIKK